MLLEKFSFKKKKGALITADFSAPTIEAYAMAWLKLTNVARETPNKIWSIQNDRRTDNVYVVCDPKAADEVKRFLTGIVSFCMNGEVKPIGKVVSESEVVVGHPVYECGVTFDVSDEEYDKDMENSVCYWTNVKERYM